MVKNMKSEKKPDVTVKKEEDKPVEEKKPDVTGSVLKKNILFNKKKYRAGEKAPKEFIDWINKKKDKNSDFLV